jgi:hypothetical protein
MPHALVIGATGMLKDASVHLLEKFDTVSAIARSPGSFVELKKDSGNFAGRLNPLIVDYTDYAGLINSLLNAVSSYGEITLALSWVHSNAPLAPVLSAKVINDTSSTLCDFYEVLGSSYADPKNEFETRDKHFEKFTNIIYHKIILGFVAEGGRTRWLTNSEISGGVISSIEEKKSSGIIGTVEPWSARP